MLDLLSVLAELVEPVSSILLKEGDKHCLHIVSLISVSNCFRTAFKLKIQSSAQDGELLMTSSRATLARVVSRNFNQCLITENREPKGSSGQPAVGYKHIYLTLK